MINSPDDVLMWADGVTWCYRYELWEMTHLSDDYFVMTEGSEEWQEFHDGL
jgi:hypothetical protein